MVRVLDITSPDINNGLGVRATLWVSGCWHHCKGCQNRWTWNHNQGERISLETYGKLKGILDKEYISGLTLSGGDPLCQDDEGLQELYRLILWFRENYPMKDIWLYTGYDLDRIDPDNSDNEWRIKIIKAVDVVVDGKYDETKRNITLAFRGSENQRIINAKKYFNNESDFLLNDVLDK